MQKENYLGIQIDYSRDSLLNEQALAMLTKKGFYKKDGEGSPQQVFARGAVSYCFGDYAFAQRIYDYVSLQWFTFASPVLSNALPIQWPEFSEHSFEDAAQWLKANVVPEGMPISCFLAAVPDDKKGIVEARTETAWLSMMGGGIGIGMGNRSPDEKSTGVMAHLRGYDADSLSYKQSGTRRGSIAAYLDVDHPEIASFLQMRSPTGGEASKKCFNLNNAVNIPDSFMRKVITGEDYELIDPKHGGTGRYLNAAKVWETILEMRQDTGEPYIHFIDTVNRHIPKWITRGTYHVSQSNLCIEIELMTSATRTAVCCLSSLNLANRDAWKDTNIVQDLVRLLDNVLEYFIQLAPPEISKAVYSAKKERAIGIGTLGWHSLLQKNMLPFESGGFGSASQLNAQVYKDIQEKAIEESLRLGGIRGEPDDVAGSGMRNSHLLAIAPNASSSSLVGASPSIEPWSSNAINAQGRAGSFLLKNPYLEELLEIKGFNTPAVWTDIVAKDGSVQHLGFLSDHEKAVFKTAVEINPLWIIEHASVRRPFVCQGQSTNLFSDGTWTAQEMSDIHFAAWAKGLKGLYYLRGSSASKVDVGTGGEKPLNALSTRSKIEFEECLSCEG